MRPKQLLATMFCFFVLNLHAQTISYSWLEKIGLAQEMLRPIKLEHSINTTTSVQKIIMPRVAGKSKSKQKSRIVIRKRTDYAWKEIALAIMNVSNGNLEVIKIKKAGQELQNNNQGFQISIEKRPSGLTWNGKNTAFSVTSNGLTYTVVANKWLERLAEGKPKEHIYSSYSIELHQKELIEAGDKHLDKDIHWAMGQLAGWGVASLAVPDKKISDVMPYNYLKNIILVEQTDPREFYDFLGGLIEYDPFERVRVIIGANGGGAYLETKSDAGALGLSQFTENTWKLMVKKFPGAQLSSWRVGASDHVESTRATALLYDYNLARLKGVFGDKILENKNLILYIAAAHNCGVNRVIAALKKPGKDWRQALRKLGRTDETMIFLEKMDYLLSQT